MHHTVLSMLDESVPQDKLTVKSPIAEDNGVDGENVGRDSRVSGWERGSVERVWGECAREV